MSTDGYRPRTWTTTEVARLCGRGKTTTAARLFPFDVGRPGQGNYHRHARKVAASALIWQALHRGDMHAGHNRHRQWARDLAIELAAIFADDPPWPWVVHWPAGEDHAAGWFTCPPSADWLAIHLDRITRPSAVGVLFLDTLLAPLLDPEEVDA